MCWWSTIHYLMRWCGEHAVVRIVGIVILAFFRLSRIRYPPEVGSRVLDVLVHFFSYYLFPSCSIYGNVGSDVLSFAVNV